MVRVRTARAPAVEQNVLQHVERNPRTSTRSVANSGFPIAASGGFSRTRHASVSRAAYPDTANRKIMHLVLLSHSGTLENVLRIPFFLMKCCFPMRHPFTREEFSTRITTIFGRMENPHTIRRRAAQIRFSVNVWAGIMGDHLIGPYLFPCRLTGLNYLLFMQRVLPQLLRDEQISASTQQTIMVSTRWSSCPF
ncbi:uncharacterized protein TNCV_1240001 [Trichonephila clavipes]|nr:uncharacterized protein TNCV_1240001 [Trichonephila clavipes]